MRVALFAPHFAEYASRLALELSRSHDVLLILDARNRLNELSASLERSIVESVQVIDFRSDTRIWRRISRLIVFLHILRFRPDVVHVQEQPDMITSMVTALVSWLHPVVLTVHDPQPHVGRDAACAGRALRHRTRIRSAARIHHVHGEYCARLLGEAEGPRRPVVMSAHAILMLPETAAEPNPGQILFFGRMEAYKGLEVLLEAVLELKRRNCRFELTLAGRGPELDRLRAAFESTGRTRVVGGWLSPEDAIAEFQRASLVVLPYIEATQSGVVAAAFANGRPVVASKTGGLADIIHDDENGQLVAPGSSDQLADALQRMLEDDALRERLAAGARKTAATTMSWAQVCKTLSEAYLYAGKPTASSDGPERVSRNARSVEKGSR